jgi:hypothetical protein
MNKLTQFIKNLFRPVFIVKKTGTYAKFDVEHGCKIILYRNGIKYPNAQGGIIVLGTGIVLDLKLGYCGIVETRDNISETGLILCGTPRIIMPGDTREVEFTFYMNDKPYFSEKKTAFEPYALKQMIGFITIVKTA